MRGSLSIAHAPTLEHMYVPDTPRDMVPISSGVGCGCGGVGNGEPISPASGKKMHLQCHVTYQLLSHVHYHCVLVMNEDCLIWS